MAIKFLSGLNLSNVTAGSILKLDSNGNIVAATAGTDYLASSLWTTSGSNIYYSSGNVTIGTSSNSAPLHVYGYQTTDPKILIEDGNTGDASMQFKISTQQYTMGIDNSDSDKFVLAASSALGTTNVLEVSTAGATAFQNGVLFNEDVTFANDVNFNASGYNFTISSDTTTRTTLAWRINSVDSWAFETDSTKSLSLKRNSLNTTGNFEISSPTRITNSLTVNTNSYTNTISAGHSGTLNLIDTKTLLLDDSFGTNDGRVFGVLQPAPFKPSDITLADSDYATDAVSNSVTNTFPNVKGEADATGITNSATFTFAEALAQAETLGGRLPTLEEVLNGVGNGSGQGYDSEYIWTQTKAGHGKYWVAKGHGISYNDAIVVDINASTPPEYRMRIFYDISKDNMPVYYDNSSNIRATSLKAENADGIALRALDGDIGITIKDDATVKLNQYTAGLLKTDASGNISLDTSTYLTSVSVDWSDIGSINGTININSTTQIGQGDTETLVSFQNSGTERGSFQVDDSANSYFVATGFKTATASTGFLKADGTVDTSTYLTSYTETDTLNSVTGRGATTTNNISVGNLTAVGGTFTDPVTIYDSTTTENPRLSVGRNAGESIQFGVTDVVNTITAKQDADSNGDHTFALDRVFAGTGDSIFTIQNDGTPDLTIDGSGVVSFNQYNTAGILKVNASGTISVDTNTYSTASGVADNADNYGSWTVSDGTNTEAITSGTTVAWRGSGATSVSYDSSTNQFNISSTNTEYSNATTSTAGLMSSTDKSKLDGIASGAEVNVQADWNATSGDAFIQNKPTLGTAAASAATDFVAVSGDTMTGTLALDNADSLSFESGKHWITYNDGEGNFNIRVGHKSDSTPNEVSTETGYAFHDEWSQGSGWREFNVSGTSITAGDDVGTWRRQMYYDYNDVRLSYQGGLKFQTTSTGITITGEIVTTGGNSTNWNSAYTYSQVGHLPLAGGTVTGMTIFEDGMRIGTGNHYTDGRASITFGEGDTTSDSMYIEYDGENLSGDNNAIIFGSAKDGVGDVFRVTYGGSVLIGSNAVATESYVTTQISNLVDSAPAALDTLNELAAALGDDANFSTTMSTALGNRLRIDVNNQSLSSTELSNARTNLGLGTAATSAATDFVAVSGDTMTGTLRLSWKWSSTDIASNTFYVKGNSDQDGFAFGVGTGVSTWFSWDNNAGLKRAIDVWNDGSSILLGAGGHNVEVQNSLYVPSAIIHTGDTDTYTQFHAGDQWRVVTGGTERLEVNNTNTTVANTLTASGGINGLTLANGGISGTNFNITGVNQLEIADPGEGIVFKSGASGDMTLAIVDDTADNILRFSGTNAVFDVAGDLSSTSLTIADSIIHEGDADTKISFTTDVININTGGGVRASISNATSKFNNDVVVAGGETFSLGERAEGDDLGRTVLIEGAANASTGEGSGRIFFTEHNSTTASADSYGLSLYYEGDPNVQLPSGFQPNTGNATWSLRRHNGTVNGVAIMSGTRTSSDVTFSGSISATSKSFDIEHPTKEGKRLVYGSLEGAEHGVYFRGKGTGEVIELPEHWTGLVHEDSITVQLTPIGKNCVWVEDIKDNAIHVGMDNDTPYFYFIQGERKDIDKLIVEQDA